MSDIEEQLGTSPPLELRRTSSASRPTIAVPHSLQSPQDRATGKSEFRQPSRCTFSSRFSTDSPQVAQVYVHGTRIPHPHFPDARFYETTRPTIPAVTEPPPAHRNSINAPSPGAYSAVSIPLAANELPSHMHSKIIEREIEQQREREREREKERKTSAPGESGENRRAVSTASNVVVRCPFQPIPICRPRVHWCQS